MSIEMILALCVTFGLAVLAGTDVRNVDQFYSDDLWFIDC